MIFLIFCSTGTIKTSPWSGFWWQSVTEGDIWWSRRDIVTSPRGICVMTIFGGNQPIATSYLSPAQSRGRESRSRHILRTERAIFRSQLLIVTPLCGPRLLRDIKYLSSSFISGQAGPSWDEILFNVRFRQYPSSLMSINYYFNRVYFQKWYRKISQLSLIWIELHLYFWNHQIESWRCIQLCFACYFSLFYLDKNVIRLSRFVWNI